MKQKTDEMPDQWVRTRLGQLPDAPPPGSTFDAERLWAQLRPELDTTPVRRPFGWAWWAAAACVSGLIFGWFLLHLPADERTTQVTNKTVKKVNELTFSQQIPHTTKNTIASESVRSAQPGRIVAYKKERNNSETPEQRVTAPTPEPAETIAQLNESPAATEIPPIVTEKLTQSQKPTVVQTKYTHRFRVVHQNELRAEEEARPKLYHTDHFVRIGMGQPDSPTPDEQPQAPALSLTNKPNQ